MVNQDKFDRLTPRVSFGVITDDFRKLMYQKSFNRIVYGVNSWDSDYNPMIPTMNLHGDEVDVWDATFGKTFVCSVDIADDDSFQHAESKLISNSVMISCHATFTHKSGSTGQYINIGSKTFYPIRTLSDFEDCLTQIKQYIDQINNATGGIMQPGNPHFFASLIIFMRQVDGSTRHLRMPIRKFIENNHIFWDKTNCRYHINRSSNETFMAKYGNDVSVRMKHGSNVSKYI